MQYLPAPTPQDLASHLGQPLDVEAQISASATISAVSAMVESHTRSNGFHPIGDGDLVAPLKSVVIAMAARSLRNPTGDSFVSAGTLTRKPGLPEPLLWERVIMSDWRKSTA